MLSHSKGDIWSTLTNYPSKCRTTGVHGQVRLPGGLWFRIQDQPNGIRSDRASIWENLSRRLDFSSFSPARIEDNLVESRRYKRGDKGIYYILKNKPYLRYIKLSDADHFLWDRIDGRRSITDLVLEFFTRYNTFAYERVGSLIHQLREESFLKQRSYQIFHTLSDRIKAHTLQARARIWAQVIFHYEVAIKGMDKTLDRLYRYFFGPLFTKWAHFLYLLINIAGISVFIFLLRSERYELFRTADSYSLGLLTFILIDVVSITVHEGAHAFATKSYGRQVPRGGFILYLGMPCFFAETSDIWMEKRSGRLAVSWAGPYSNIILASVCSLFILIFPFSSINHLLIKVAFINYLSAFLNLNPLLELDGYFMLIDWLEIPFLRKKSLSFIKRDLFRKLRQRERLSKEERIYTIFGTLAGIWTVVAVTMSLLLLRWRVIRMFKDLLYGGTLIEKVVAGAVVLLFVIPVLLSILAVVYLILRRCIRYMLSLSIWKRNDYLLLGLCMSGLVLNIIPLFMEHPWDVWFQGALHLLILSLLMYTCLEIIREAGHIKIAGVFYGLIILSAPLFVIEILGHLIPGPLFSSPVFLILGITSLSLCVFESGNIIKSLSTLTGIAHLLVGMGLFILSAVLISPQFLNTNTISPYPYFYPLIVPLCLCILMGTTYLLLVLRRTDFQCRMSECPSANDLNRMNWVIPSIMGFLLDNLSRYFGKTDRVVRDFNHTSESRSWGIYFTGEGVRSIPNLGLVEGGLMYSKALDFFLNRLVREGGYSFIKRLFTYIYDNLNWEEREVVENYVLKKIPMGREIISHRDKDVEMDAREFLRTVPLFYELEREDIERMSTQFRKESFSKGDNVIVQGERGDKFYLIKEGAARVMVVSDVGAKREVAELGRGDYFGEIALIRDIPRTATVTADGPLEVLSLKKDDFDRLVKSHLDILEKVEAAEETLEILEKMPLFSEFGVTQIKFVASKMKLREVKKGEEVIKQGEAGKEFFVIRRGRFGVVKEEGGRSLTIATLSPGEYFGEIALLKEVPRTASVIAGEDGELLVLYARDFHGLLGKYLYTSQDLEMVSSRRMYDIKRG